MTVYDIHGIKITISTQLENYRFVDKKFSPHVESSYKIFKEWYSCQSSCENVYKNKEVIKSKLISPIVATCMSTLKQVKIYTLDESIFKRKYLSDCFDEFENLLCEMMAAVCEIDDNRQAMAEYRKMRKDSRTKYYGVGYDMASTMGASMRAGILNAGTGVLHGTFNLVGNTINAIGAGSKKAGLLSKFEEPLANAIYYAVFSAEYALMMAMTCEGKFQFASISDDDASKASAMLKNFSAVPSSQRLSHIVSALQTDPYNLEIYIKIWQEWGDPDNELQRMAKDFGIGFEERIKAFCGKWAAENDSRHLSDYNASNNKPRAAVKYEKNVQIALSAYKTFCDKHAIDYNFSNYYSKYQKILADADNGKKEVEGIRYETVEQADSVRHDIALFYKTFDSCDLSQKNETVAKVKSAEYKSDSFISRLDGRITEEFELRDPFRLHENLDKLRSDDSICDEIFNAFEIDRVDDETLDIKRRNIQGKAHLKCDEFEIFLIERDVGWGHSMGKSGILATNKHLIVYDSSTQHSCNIQGVKEIECLGEDEYRVIPKSDCAINSSFSWDKKFKLHKKDLYLSQQNQIADLLTRMIFTIQNIGDNALEQIDNIRLGGALCPCGTYLRPEEKKCPVCHRSFNPDGGFEESIACPMCGAYIKKTAKFCSSCRHDMSISTVLCPKCGKSVAEGAKFCSKCGYQMAESVPRDNSVSVCPNCGNEIKQGKNFCSKCGTKVN